MRSGNSEGGASAEPLDLALTDEIRTLLDAVAVATVSAALRKRGYVDIFVEGVYPNRPDDRILGPAKTLRFIPYRPDLFAEYGAGFNAQKRAFDNVSPGEVLVIEARGVSTTGTVGDVLALRAKYRGAVGIVSDGSVRDFLTVQDIAMPVFSQGAASDGPFPMNAEWRARYEAETGNAEK